MNVREQRDTVTCPDGFPMEALVVAPTEGRWPGLLLVSDPFGLNAELRRLARVIAEAGHVVFAPNLMQRGSFIWCVRRLMADLKAERGRGVDDLVAAQRRLACRDDVVATKLAVMGLCMGGGFALLLGRTGLFSVGAPFYGPVPRSLEGSCPVVASYGGRDRMLAADAERLARELRQHHVRHDLKVYPNSGHSFMTRPPNRIVEVVGRLAPGHAAHDPDAEADATQRVLAFLAAEFG